MARLMSEINRLKRGCRNIVQRRIEISHITDKTITAIFSHSVRMTVKAETSNATGITHNDNKNVIVNITTNNILNLVIGMSCYRQIILRFMQRYKFINCLSPFHLYIIDSWSRNNAFEFIPFNQYSGDYFNIQLHSP